MSHIYEALKKLERETSTKRFGWGTIGKDILKPEPPRPRKKTSSYLIPVLLTACATAAVTYGVTLNSDLLWKSPSPSSEISPALSSKAAQIPPGVTEAAKTLPTAPDERIANIQTGLAERTKKSPPGSAKSSGPTQKPAPATDGSSLRKSSPTPLPRPGVSKLKSTPPVQVYGSLPRAPSPPPVQPAAPEGEDSEVTPQTTRPDAPMYISPQMKEEIERSRAARREYYRRAREMREKAQGNPQLDNRTPVPPANEGTPRPGSISRGAEVLPRASASAQAPAQSPNTSAEGQLRLKISGIVWHEDPAMRRAVINGSFAAEGSEIQGVKVVEIFPTKVRLSYGNQVFELSAFE